MKFRPGWPALFLVFIVVTVCACSGRSASASHKVQEPAGLTAATVYIADSQYIYGPSTRYRPRSVLLAGDGTYELTNMTWFYLVIDDGQGHGDGSDRRLQPELWVGPVLPCAGGSHFY